MSEQPERVKEMIFTQDCREAKLVELRPGETIVGPLEMAVIEAAKAQAEAWPEALASLEATTQTSVPFVRWERLAHATEAAVRAMKELEKSQ